MVQHHPSDLQQEKRGDVHQPWLWKAFSAKPVPTGTEILRNMAMPFWTSANATSWGVDTMMAPTSPLVGNNGQAQIKLPTIHINQLAKSQWDVAGSRGHINYQGIKF